MKKYIIGALVGSALTMASAAAVKQYILTEAAYPIVVNGEAFSDPDTPILNYEGSTYVPLARLGDLTGVFYTWNDTEKRVEILTDVKVTSEAGVETIQKSVNISPNETAREKASRLAGKEIKFEKPKGLVVQGEKTFFYAYDRDGTYKGTFTDDDDGDVLLAKLKGKEVPPKISEGWLGTELLGKVYEADVVFQNDEYIFKTSRFATTQKEYFRLQLPLNWKEAAKTEILKTKEGVSFKRFFVPGGVTSEWVSKEELSAKAGVKVTNDIGPKISSTTYQLKEVFYTEDDENGRVNLYEFLWPGTKVKTGEIVDLNGIRVKDGMYYREDLLSKNIIKEQPPIIAPYFSIRDLQKVGLLK